MLNRTAALDIVVPFLMQERIEGFRGEAYQDLGRGKGIWTYGFGHTAGVKEGMKISRPTAIQLLKFDTNETAEIIENRLPNTLNPNQFAALISFTFNVGPGKMGEKDGFLTLKSGRPSTLLKMIQEFPEPTPEQLKETADQFLRWIYAGGEVLSGLCTRRTRERELFLTPYTSPGDTAAPASDSSGVAV